MTDIDTLIAEARDWIDFVEGSPLTGEKLAERLLDALTAERAKVAKLEAEVKDAREMFESVVRTHADNVRRYDRLKEIHAGRVDYLCRDQADLRDKLSDAKAEAARWRVVAGELAGALDKELVEAVNCWLHHYGENPEGSAEPEHIARGRAALTRYKQESGQ